MLPENLCQVERPLDGLTPKLCLEGKLDIARLCNRR